ncbi:MAG: DNA ligase [Parashewanella sp.]
MKITFYFPVSSVIYRVLSLLVISTYACLANALPMERELQLASKLQLTSPIGSYLVSEKYDGVRGRWDGKQMWTRAGNKIELPLQFTQNFPMEVLDGELWIGRGKFEQVSALVRTKDTKYIDWKNVRFMVFDVPEHQGSFVQRYRYALNKFGGVSSHLSVIKQTSVKDKAALEQWLTKIVAQGGEGLMLHKKTSLYRDGRNPDLMKMKLYSDAEAIVVKHLEGKGKFEGMMGALLVEMPSGKRFKIGSGFTNKDRQHPPKVGSVITYKYYGMTQKGTPRFASFLRIRSDNQIYQE